MTTCPVCGQPVSLVPAGLILAHRHASGKRCPGSALYPHEADRIARGVTRSRRYQHPDTCNRCDRDPCECND